MTVYELMKAYRADDDLEVIIHVINREYDDDIETTAFSIQSRDPSTGIEYEVETAYVQSWNCEAGTMYIDIEI